MRDLLYEALAFGGQSLSFENVAGMGKVLGRFFWRVLASRRRLASEAMAFHLDIEPEKALALAGQSFQHNFRSFLEIFLTRKLDWRFVNERLRINNPDVLTFLQNTNRPVVIATGHLGAWEFMGALRLFFPSKSGQVVVRRPKDMALHKTMLRLRAQPGMEVVEHRRAVFKVLRLLRRGGVAGFLVDHNCGRDEAIFLPFLKREAAVNMGPALLAVRAKALVFPIFLIREDPGKYAVYMDEPLDTETLTGPREERVRAAAEFYTRAVEKYVRLYPEQWVWMHKRWKTRPLDE
ncbi:MAG: lysophospholipid acyltransferase family protein [Thermodesulfobacteriota bacterium]|nr:lysophospholipid acyltransferase family protein [Thermodesulfobacteriota bacterium]